MNWTNKNIDLGEIKQNVEKIITFYSEKELDINEIIVSCGCIKEKYDKKKKTLTIKYTPVKIPIHKNNDNHYFTNKTITVIYKDGSRETLNFKAKITN